MMSPLNEGPWSIVHRPNFSLNYCPSTHFVRSGQFDANGYLTVFTRIQKVRLPAVSERRLRVELEVAGIEPASDGALVLSLQA